LASFLYFSNEPFLSPTFLSFLLSSPAMAYKRLPAR
jgi:hypothetical protein